jgi:hypothetical protein
MSGKTNNKSKLRPSPARHSGRKLACVILSVMVLGVCYLAWVKYAKTSGSDPSKLVGQWIRPDGGYILALKRPSPEGQIKATYFNPKSINVSRSEWEFRDGSLKVFVELHDVNYPGSTYTLEYMPKEDLLMGIYFQAVHQQQFEISFKRKR